MGVTPGEPRESPKPQPLGDITIIILFTACTICALFLIWRKASSLRGVVSHQLKAFTSSDGRIRLSEDDGPPANDFLADDSDDDHERFDDSHGETLLQDVRIPSSRTSRKPNGGPPQGST